MGKGARFGRNSRLMALISGPFLFWSVAVVEGATAGQSRPAPVLGARLPTPAERTQIAEVYGRLPLRFEPNLGQAGPEVRYLARGPGYALFLDARGAEFVLASADARTRVRLNLVGSLAPVEIVATEKLPGLAHYLIGNDRARWRRHVPGFARVAVRNVYPGIDLVYYGNQRRLEYDFLIAPGADPHAIRLQFEGVTAIRTDAAGDLLLETAAGLLRQHKPKVYQTIGGRQVDIATHYRIEADRSVRFALADYDRRHALVIDPVLVYSTYLGAFAGEAAYGIAVGADGSAYVTGETTSGSFPTASAFQATIGGLSDVFVTKLNPSGNALVYSTYLGGSGEEVGAAIAVDAAGNAYVTGHTTSSNFPTQSALYASLGGVRDAFVLKLDATGSALLYSTYLGGTAEDRGTAIAIDASGAAYVAGVTASGNFPTASAFIGGYLGGPRDAFLAKLAPSGSALSFSTFYGGSGDDAATGVAVDAANAAYLCGYTASTNLPTQSPLFGASAGGVDAFVAKFTPAGNALSYATYLGGSNDDRATTLAVDSTGAAYIGGWTFSTNFPRLNAVRNTFAGLYEGFLTKINPAGNALVYSTFHGGDGEDYVAAVAVDASASAIVAGYTSSSDFPVVNSSAAFYNGRNRGAFLTKFAPSGNAVSYSTYLGGNADDQANAVAVDAAGAVYVAGTTQAPDFPTASFQNTLQGGFDAFITKFVDGTPLTFTVTTNPAGLNVTVDGVTRAAPHFYGWAAGSQHTLSAPSPQGSGATRYTFSGWSQGGAQTQTITAPNASTTYTANFTTQHQLTLAVSPPGSGTVSASPASGDSFYNQGTSVQIGVSPSPGYNFSGFSGDLSGGAAPQSVVMSQPRSVTAHFACAYSLSALSANVDGGANSGSFTVTAGATCPFTVSSNASWITLFTGGATGTAVVNYQVAANPTSSARTGTITVFGGSAALTYTITQGPMPPPTIHFVTVPSGRQIVVDGVAVATPASFAFVPGSVHEISVVSPQTVGGVRYSFSSWSDGGPQTHQIVAPASGSLTITANFTTAYQLITNVNPPGSGAIVTTPSSADGFYAPGTIVQVTASPVVGATFTGWSDALTGTANPQSLSMDVPRIVTANFSPMTCGSNYTLTPQFFIAEPSGGNFSVNVASAPGCFWQASLAGYFINPFVSIQAPGAGTGNGSFQFSVQANPNNLPRTASVNVAGQLVQILQRANDVPQLFTDVPPVHIFFEYITLLKAYGTYNGCSPTQFCPNAIVSRAQMAELVIRSMMGDNFPYQTTPFFSDVPASHPQFKYIQKMKELGITAGCTLTTYCPSDPVTRGQMAVFLIRGRLGVTQPTQFSYNASPYFLDVPTNHIFFPFIQKMKDLGITVGCSATSYCPDDQNTMGQMAVFLIRAFNTP